jgi:DNA-binding winged helix-turn-helix (wHTH) protein/Tol biopolymer transport system component
LPGRQNNGSRLRFGQFEVQLSEEKLLKRGVPVRIENLPFQVLSALLDRPGELVSREELRGRLWPNGTYVDFDEGLNTAIRKLRYSLGDSAESPLFIETLPRRGYRFVAPVAIIPAVLQHPGETPTAVGKSGNGQGTLPQISARVSPRKRPLWIAFLVAALVAGGLISWWLRRNSPGARRESMEIQKLRDTGSVNCVAISPDGRYVLYARRTGEKVSLRMRQVASGGDVEVLAPQQVDFVGLTFSPDGNYVYFVRSDKNDPGYKYLYVMPALGGAARKLITDIDSPVNFSPDGQQFVYTRGIPTKNQIEIHVAKPDGSSDRVLTVIAESFAGYQPGATWSPDGRTIAVSVLHRGSTESCKLFAVAAATGGQRELYSLDGYIGRPLWTRKGDAILVMLVDRILRRGQLWTIAFPDGRKQQRITNDLSDYDVSIDMTRDEKQAAVLVNASSSQVWVASTTDLSKLQQITSGETSMFEAIESKPGSVIALSDGQLWSMTIQGTELQKFASLDAVHITRCGEYLVANVRNQGTGQFVRLGQMRADSVVLSSGVMYSGTCAADGKFVYYVDLSPPQRIMKIGIEGGIPVEVAKVPGDDVVGPVEVSQDGRFLAFPWEQFTPDPGVHFEIVSTTDGSSVKSFNAPAGVYTLPCLRWSVNGSAIQYVVTRDGAANLWEQPLAGGTEKQLTKFSTGLIFNFAWTLDGKHLLLSKGEVRSDLLMLNNIQ